MRTREIACIHYVAEKNCNLGREGTFRHACQHCPKYMAKLGSLPARVNTKQKKLEQARKRDWDD